LKSFIEEFGCPICFNAIENCLITPCGHNFCKNCIEECINRKHQCPCCNHPTTQSQLLKNHHFDNLLKIISSERDIASKKYFETLISSSLSLSGNHPKESTASGNSAASAHKKELSPIEKVFHSHMKKSLNAYEEYYKDLEKKKR